MATPGTTKGINKISTQEPPSAQSKHPNSSESQQQSSGSRPQRKSLGSQQQGQPANSRRPLNPIAQKTVHRLTAIGFTKEQAEAMARELQGAHAHAHTALQQTRATKERLDVVSRKADASDGRSKTALVEAQAVKKDMVTVKDDIAKLNERMAKYEEEQRKIHAIICSLTETLEELCVARDVDASLGNDTSVHDDDIRVTEDNLARRKVESTTISDKLIQVRQEFQAANPAA